MTLSLALHFTFPLQFHLRFILTMTVMREPYGFEANRYYCCPVRIQFVRHDKWLSADLDIPIIL